MYNDPVRIVRMTEGTTELKNDGHQFASVHAWETTFNAGDDWHEGLSFTIKNVSDKKMPPVANNPSHKCIESLKPNSDRLAFVVQVPDCS